MQARILFLTDLHKRDTDFTTITGYTKAVDAVQEDILEAIKCNNITHLVIGGDWYDKGYRSINRVFNDSNYDKLLHDAVNGNVYLCRGNHLFLERDSNPEMYLIQPCEAMPPVHPIKTTETPLFKSPDTLQIGPLQISLFHFDKLNKGYVAKRLPETTYHIGVFHDDCVLPTSIRQASGDHGITETTALSTYYNNIDLAICNHIHMAVGLTHIGVLGRQVPVFIPGSLCITKNQPSELHSSVKLPVVTLEDDNTVHVQTLNMSLHTELLRIFDKKETVKGNGAKQILNVNPTEISAMFSPKENISFKQLLIRKGYSARVIELVDKAAKTGITGTEANNILYKEDI